MKKIVFSRVTKKLEIFFKISLICDLIEDSCALISVYASSLLWHCITQPWEKFTYEKKEGEKGTWHLSIIMKIVLTSWVPWKAPQVPTGLLAHTLGTAERMRGRVDFECPICDSEMYVLFTTPALQQGKLGNTWHLTGGADRISHESLSFWRRELVILHRNQRSVVF